MKMRTIYLGDIHGNFNVVTNYVKDYDITNANIIQVGDFGVGFTNTTKERRVLSLYNKILSKRNVVLWAIRGNHDFKPYFDNDPFGLSNIKLVKDYTVLNFNDKNILCVGGAISVDRMLRKTKSQRSGKFVEGNTTSYIKNDPDLKGDLLFERAQMDEMFRILNTNNYIQNHYYGHYHKSEDFNYMGTTHRLLGVNEFWEEMEYEDYESIFK